MIQIIEVTTEDSVLLQDFPEVQAYFPEEGEKANTRVTLPDPNYLTYAVIQLNSSGKDVKFAQKQLKVYMPSEAYYVIVDGAFGSITETAVKAFQKKSGLTQDGVVGGGTWPRLGPNVYSGMASYWNKELSIKEVQRLLKLAGRYTGDIDGIFGTGTLNAIKNFQQSYGITQDGIWGKQCWGIVEQGWI